MLSAMDDFAIRVKSVSDSADFPAGTSRHTSP